MATLGQNLAQCIANQSRPQDLNSKVSLMMPDYMNLIDQLLNMPWDFINGFNLDPFLNAMLKLNDVSLAGLLDGLGCATFVNYLTGVGDLQNASDCTVNSLLDAINNLVDSEFDFDISLMLGSLRNLKLLFPSGAFDSNLLNATLLNLCYPDTVNIPNKDDILALANSVGYNDCLNFDLPAIAKKEDPDREYSPEFFNALDGLQTAYDKTQNQVIQAAKFDPNTYWAGKRLLQSKCACVTVV